MISGIKQILEKHFQGKDLARIVAFLDKGFCQNGQMVVASIFVFAQEHRVSVADVLVQCRKEWERNWNFQHPEIKGNPDAPGAAGLQNRASLSNIYTALGISPPQPGKKQRVLGKHSPKIPTKAIVVITSNSVYHLGSANENGNRTVSRDVNPLDFKFCKIARLVVGEVMELRASKTYWKTTPVVEIR